MIIEKTTSFTTNAFIIRNAKLLRSLIDLVVLKTKVQQSIDFPLMFYFISGIAFKGPQTHMLQAFTCLSVWETSPNFYKLKFKIFYFKSNVKTGNI